VLGHIRPILGQGIPTRTLLITARKGVAIAMVAGVTQQEIGVFIADCKKLDCWQFQVQETLIVVTFPERETAAFRSAFNSVFNHQPGINEKYA